MQVKLSFRREKKQKHRSISGFHSFEKINVGATDLARNGSF